MKCSSTVSSSIIEKSLTKPETAAGAYPLSCSCLTQLVMSRVDSFASADRCPAGQEVVVSAELLVLTVDRPCRPCGTAWRCGEQRPTWVRQLNH
jgi:hypothetical protein